MNNGELRNLMKSVDVKYLDEAFADLYNNAGKETPENNRRIGIKWIPAVAVMTTAAVAVAIPLMIRNSDNGNTGIPDSDSALIQPTETTRPVETTVKETKPETTVPETTESHTVPPQIASGNTTVPAQPETPATTAAPETQPAATLPETPEVPEWTLPAEKPDSLYDVPVSDKMMSDIIAIVAGDGTTIPINGDSGANASSPDSYEITPREKNLKLLAAFSGFIFKGEIVESVGSEEEQTNTYKIKIKKIYKDAFNNSVDDEIILKVNIDRTELLGQGVGKEVIVFAERSTDGEYYCTYDKSVCFKNNNQFYYMISGQTVFYEEELQEELDN